MELILDVTPYKYVLVNQLHQANKLISMPFLISSQRISTPKNPKPTTKRYLNSLMTRIWAVFLQKTFEE